VADTHTSYAHIPPAPRDLLDEIYSREGAEIWWNSHNRLLRTPTGIARRPADLWAGGEQDVVMQVLEMLAEGTF